MNELKFRAWHKRKKVYLSHGELFAMDCSNEFPFLALIKGYYKEDDMDIILEQYTGLKDKNDKEIYVGDILIDRECNRSYVISNLYEFHILFKNYIEREETTLTHIRVGGHIHENKELLK